MLHKAERFPPTSPQKMRPKLYLHQETSSCTGLISDWVYMAVKPLECLWLWRVESVHSNPSLEAPGMYLQHKWLWVCYYPSFNWVNFFSFLSWAFKIKYETISSPVYTVLRNPSLKRFSWYCLHVHWLTQKPLAASLAMLWPSHCQAYGGELQRQGL